MLAQRGRPVWAVGCGTTQGGPGSPLRAIESVSPPSSLRIQVVPVVTSLDLAMMARRGRPRLLPMTWEKGIRVAQWRLRGRIQSKGGVSRTHRSLPKWLLLLHPRRIRPWVARQTGSPLSPAMESMEVALAYRPAGAWWPTEGRVSRWIPSTEPRAHSGEGAHRVTDYLVGEEGGGRWGVGASAGRRDVGRWCLAKEEGDGRWARRRCPDGVRVSRRGRRCFYLCHGAYVPSDRIGRPGALSNSFSRKPLHFYKLPNNFQAIKFRFQTLIFCQILPLLLHPIIFSCRTFDLWLNLLRLQNMFKHYFLFLLTP